MKINIKLLLLCAFMGLSNPIMAQNSGDRLYSQGLELQKKQTVQAQKSAIAKFQSAKKLYDSAAKKKQCDDAIAVSNNIIKTISTNKRSKSSSQIILHLSHGIRHEYSRQFNKHNVEEIDNQYEDYVLTGEECFNVRSLRANGFLQQIDGKWREQTYEHLDDHGYRQLGMLPLGTAPY